MEGEESLLRQTICSNDLSNVRIELRGVGSDCYVVCYDKEKGKTVTEPWVEGDSLDSIMYRAIVRVHNLGRSYHYNYPLEDDDISDLLRISMVLEEKPDIDCKKAATAIMKACRWLADIKGESERTKQKMIKMSAHIVNILAAFRQADKLITAEIGRVEETEEGIND